MLLASRHSSSFLETFARCYSVKRKVRHGVHTPLDDPRPFSSASSRLQDSSQCEERSAQPISRPSGFGQSTSEDEQGAMTRRLAGLSEVGGQRDRKAIEGAGFSEDVKQQLLDKISSANLSRAQHPSAFAQAAMPLSAPKQARDAAGAKPWTGSESVSDAALRMLNEARRPIRIPFKVSNPQRPPKSIDTGRPTKGSPGGSAGIRLADARDKSSMYGYLQDPNLSDHEKEQMRKKLKERFTPVARPIPMTLQGLASLANERIEDAIAR